MELRQHGELIQYFQFILHGLLSHMDLINIFNDFNITVNPADSKHKVYRHNYDDWFVGNRQISWDPGAAELQDDANVDIHLFSLKV